MPSSNGMEIYYVPLTKCKEYIKKYYDSSKDELYVKAERLKYMDINKKESKPEIDFDVFSAIIIEQHHIDMGKIRDSSHDIFCACDFDNSGYMEFAEFYFIFKYIEPTRFSVEKCKEIFTQNIDQADSISKKSEVISFNRFAELCSNYNLFGEKAQNTFMGIQSNTELEKYDALFNKGSKSIISSVKALALNLRVSYKYFDTVLSTLQEKIDLSNKVSKTIVLMYKLIHSLIEDIVQENVISKILGEFKEVANGPGSFSCIDLLRMWENNESTFPPNHNT